MGLPAILANQLTVRYWAVRLSGNPLLRTPKGPYSSFENDLGPQMPLTIHRSAPPLGRVTT